jgi:hypothetical protein
MKAVAEPSGRAVICHPEWSEESWRCDKEIPFRVASPLSLDKDERPLSLDTFITSDNPRSSTSLSD